MTAGPPPPGTGPGPLERGGPFKGIRPFKSLKRILPRSLFGRTLLILVVPLILVQAVATWTFYDRHWDTISKRLANAVAGEIAVLIGMIERRPDEAAAAIASVGAATDLRASLTEGASLPADADTSAFPAGDGILERRLREAMRARTGRPFRLDTRSFDREILIETALSRPVAVPGRQPSGVLRVVVPRERLFSSTTYIVLLWMVGSSLVLLAVAGLFLRNQIRPIRQLAAAADAFGKGRTVGDFRAAGAAEVRQAALAFARMRDRIQRQIGQRTDMLSGVSHDLRTPLTRIKLELEMLGARLGADAAEEVEALKRDVAEMERMLDAYLGFARGEGTEAVQPVDLAALLDEVAADASRSGGTIVLDRPPHLWIQARPDALRRCLANLVGNAARYGSQVRIRARGTSAGVEVAVDDDGPGIPPDERENVFRPFYRLDASRNAATGGVGLGLSIARDVARGHGGDIRLGTSPQGGVRAVLELPF